MLCKTGDKIVRWYKGKRPRWVIHTTCGVFLWVSCLSGRWSWIKHISIIFSPPSAFFFSSSCCSSPLDRLDSREHHFKRGSQWKQEGVCSQELSEMLKLVVYCLIHINRVTLFKAFSFGTSVQNNTLLGKQLIIPHPADFNRVPGKFTAESCLGGVLVLCRFGFVSIFFIHLRECERKISFMSGA